MGNESICEEGALERVQGSCEGVMGDDLGIASSLLPEMVGVT